jgi:hypothetical protein
VPPPSALAQSHTLIFYGRAGVFARVRPYISSLTAPRHNARWHGINRALYRVAFGCIGIEAITGSMLYFTPSLLARQMGSAVHRWAAWLLIGYTMMHVLAQFVLAETRQILEILNLRNRIAEEIVKAVVELAIEEPASGQVRAANELKKSNHHLAGRSALRLAAP